jgi:FtsP/CotA-like multicopper oxidase with cupredoxin domain
MRARAVGATERTVRFSDDTHLDVDAVLWATGYQPDHSWIQLPVVDATGRVQHRRGVTEVPGCYFLGLPWQHTRGSALLGWVQDDAEFIAREIGAFAVERNARESATAREPFPTETAGAPESWPTETIDLSDSATFDLRIGPVTKQVGDAKVRMLAYNGSIPGPTLRVREGSEVIVNVVNEGDLEATVHWHGLRLENASDGTHETQAPIPVGGAFSYRLQFPDPGLYWYHPHIREDFGQEMGLYANILVVPSDPDYWPQVHREVVLTLDDVLIESGKVAPFGRGEPNYVAMGRFGNVLLVGGETNASLSFRSGEVVRFFLTNTANTRVFNVAVPGARMKLVGGDSGRCEREAFVDSVILAPSERVVVDVLFEKAGQLALEHRTPKRTYPLAALRVGPEPALPELAEKFAVLRDNEEWVGERERLSRYFDAPPDKTLALVAEMNMEAPGGAVQYVCPMHPEIVRDKAERCPKCGMKLVAVAAQASYTCPMHPEIVRDKAERCPKCGMKLVGVAARVSYACPMHPEIVRDKAERCPKCGMKLVGVAARVSYACPMHPEIVRDKAERCPKCGMKLVPAAGAPKGGQGGTDHHHDHKQQADPMTHGHEGHGAAGDTPHASHAGHGEFGGIEWEDDMVDVNRVTTPANTHWRLIDRETGAVNHTIRWRFQVGDRVKLRLVNEMDSDHPMHHPFHVHGAGRFVVLARGGAAEANLVWKDTVLVRTGETVDILLCVTNPGIWMAHCHIAEHHESGMMFSFEVVPADPSSERG